MNLAGVTFTGPELDDIETLERLPESLQRVLRQLNGFVAYRGGLHVRGACHEPVWHSLREVWRGEHALHRRYEPVLDTDVPFAQDAVGDQWLLRDGQVIRLSAETGDVESVGLDLADFWPAVERDPVETLGLHPLLQYEHEGGGLEPGQLLSVYPPFCTEQSGAGVSLRAVPAAERLDFLAWLSAQLSDVSDGEAVEFRIVD